MTILILFLSFNILFAQDEMADDRSCFDRAYDVYYAENNHAPSDDEFEQMKEACEPMLGVEDAYTIHTSI